MSPLIDTRKKEELSRYMADILYNLLTSTEKSIEYGSEFLEMIQELRLENYSYLRGVSKIFGILVADYMESLGEGALSSEEKNNMLGECLSQAKEGYTEENGS